MAEQQPAPKKTVPRFVRVPKPAAQAQPVQLAQQAQPAPVAALPPAKRIESINDWAKLRQKNSRYTYTPQGDLVGPDQTILEMIPKVQASPEVIQQRLEERKAKIAEAEANFTKARRELYEIVGQYRAGVASEGDVIRANQAVHVADCALALIAKYPRYIQAGGEYIFRDLHVNDFYNVRKFPDPVLEIEYTTFPLEMFWTDRRQEKITLDGPADDYNPFNEQPDEEEKKNAARRGAIIAANRARSMAGRV